MQDKVKNFNQNKNCHLKPMGISERMIDIMSEVGELGKEVLKSTHYGTEDFVMSENYIMEFGDVIYSLLSLANETGIDSSEALDKVLDKYAKRIAKNGSMGSGN